MKRRPETDKLERELSNLGHAMRRQVMYRGLLALSGYALIFIAGLYVLDFITDMPYPVRLAVIVAGIVYGIIWLKREFLVEAGKPVYPDEISLIVETKHPELQSRMISTLQFQEAQEIPVGVSVGLVDALVEQTFGNLRDFNIWDVLDKSRLKRRSIFFVASVFLLASVILFAPKYFAAFAMRVAIPGVEYPTRTIIVEIEAPNPLAAGDMFKLMVKAGGVLPELGQVEVEDENGEDAEYELLPTEKSGHYSSEIPGLSGSVNVWVYLGDDREGPYNIKPEVRPYLESIEVNVEYPKYSELPPETLSTGNMRVLEGCKLNLGIKPSKPLESMKLVGGAKGLKLPELTEKDGVWSGSLVADQPFAFSLTMKDKLGLEGKDMPQYRVSVIRDRMPTVRIIRPRKRWEAAPVSRVPLEFHVQDDFKIRSIEVKYELFDEAEFEKALEEGREPKGKVSTYDKVENINAQKFPFKGFWQNSRIKPVPGQVIKFWIEATDNREPEPQVARSEELTVQVITPEQYRTYLLQRFGEMSSTMADQITEIKGSARDLENLLLKMMKDEDR